jgi:hypothetical protein
MSHAMFNKTMIKETVGPVALGLIRDIAMKEGVQVCPIHYWSCEPYAAQHYDRYIYFYTSQEITDSIRSLNDDR